MSVRISGDVDCYLIINVIGIILIIKGNCVAPIYHTRWEPKALYSNTNNTRVVGVGRDRQGCEKNKIICEGFNLKLEQLMPQGCGILLLL